jgi:hypothetical protein
VHNSTGLRRIRHTPEQSDRPHEWICGEAQMDEKQELVNAVLKSAKDGQTSDGRMKNEADLCPGF